MNKKPTAIPVHNAPRFTDEELKIIDVIRGSAADAKLNASDFDVVYQDLGGGQVAATLVVHPAMCVGAGRQDALRALLARLLVRCLSAGTTSQTPASATANALLADSSLVENLYDAICYMMDDKGPSHTFDRSDLYTCISSYWDGVTPFSEAHVEESNVFELVIGMQKRLHSNDIEVTFNEKDQLLRVKDIARDEDSDEDDSADSDDSEDADSEEEDEEPRADDITHQEAFIDCVKEMSKGSPTMMRAQFEKELKVQWASNDLLDAASPEWGNEEIGDFLKACRGRLLNFHGISVMLSKDSVTIDCDKRVVEMAPSNLTKKRDRSEFVNCVVSTMRPITKPGVSNAAFPLRKTTLSNRELTALICEKWRTLQIKSRAPAEIDLHKHLDNLRSEFKEAGVAIRLSTQTITLTPITIPPKS